MLRASYKQSVILSKPVILHMRNLILIALVFNLMACEKNVELNISASDPVLVVDAQVENGQPARVVLTKSLNYFSELSSQALSNSFVHNADVFVSNGSVTQKLIEYTVPLSPGINAFYYSVNPAAPATAFLGEVGKDYTLNVTAENMRYTSTTSILPFNATLDSVWVKPAPQNPDTTKRLLYLRITDPPGRGNYVRYFTRVNSGQFLPGENSVFDDQIIDGTTFDVTLNPGIDRNDPPKADSNYFKRGDTISVKFAIIPKSTYTFWNTWEFAYQSIGNPFAQPNKVIGNISNGALGAFCGYASRQITIVAQ